MFEQSFSDILRPHRLVERVVVIRQIPEFVDRRLTGSMDESRIRIDRLSFDDPESVFQQILCGSFTGCLSSVSNLNVGLHFRFMYAFSSVRCLPAS
jgi:hypothetical protein